MHAAGKARSANARSWTHWMKERNDDCGTYIRLRLSERPAGKCDGRNGIPAQRTALRMSRVMDRPQFWWMEKTWRKIPLAVLGHLAACTEEVTSDSTARRPLKRSWRPLLRREVRPS